MWHWCVTCRRGANATAECVLIEQQKVWVLWVTVKFSANLSIKFLISKLIQRYININVHRSAVKVPVILSDFNNRWIFFEYLGNLLQTNLMKTRPLAAGCFARTHKLTTGQEDKTKRIICLRIFANALNFIYWNYSLAEQKFLIINANKNKENYWYNFRKHDEKFVRLGYTKAPHFQKLMFFSVCRKWKSTNDVSLKHVLIFGILDTSQIVTPFHALWSHNVSHNCEHATFNVDCCYGNLQQLLLICMCTKASVTFQAIHHPTSSTPRNILRLLTYKRKSLFCRSDKPVVFWFEGQG
jgi:hypothetical protein